MYSLDYRLRVFEIKKEEGLTYEETRKRFRISMRTLFNWRKRLKPKIKRNKPATKIDMKGLEGDVKKYPDAYLEERAKRFDVSIPCVFYALRRLKISYKKNSASPQSGRSGTYTLPNKNDEV